ncbi:MAG: type II toxin-antitoxin system HicA family toxin [Deltaproteobacteria bacterium]|nr:type II toxin-antitoxin system HicA family toxin [Deltaproteobacteria bacterium]
MKRRDLLHHLSQNGCRLLREGGEHSIWENPTTNHRASIPRHREVSDFTMIRICKQLGVPLPVWH